MSAEVYVDNSKSAWKRNRARKDWDRMLHSAIGKRIQEGGARPVFD